jgi:hypothetical protein
MKKLSFVILFVTCVVFIDNCCGMKLCPDGKPYLCKSQCELKYEEEESKYTWMSTSEIRKELKLERKRKRKLKKKQRSEKEMLNKPGPVAPNDGGDVLNFHTLRGINLMKFVVAKELTYYQEPNTIRKKNVLITNLFCEQIISVNNSIADQINALLPNTFRLDRYAGISTAQDFVSDLSARLSESKRQLYSLPTSYMNPKHRRKIREIIRGVSNIQRKVQQKRNLLQNKEKLFIKVLYFIFGQKELKRQMGYELFNVHSCSKRHEFSLHHLNAINYNNKKFAVYTKYARSNHKRFNAKRKSR